MKWANGVKLNRQQLEKKARKQEFLDRLAALEAETVPVPLIPTRADTRTKVQLATRRLSMDMTRPLVHCGVDDLVRVANGDTGVVKFVGEVHFLDGYILGLLMDQWSPNYQTGTIDGKLYFDVCCLSVGGVSLLYVCVCVCVCGLGS